MGWSPVVAWICLLLGHGLALSIPRPPQLIGCVFHNKANITCHWEAGEPPATEYTLHVQPIPRSLPARTCRTSKTSCTVDSTGISATLRFCITVTGHSPDKNVTFIRPCQPGRTEVILPPVTIERVTPLPNQPLCLNITWNCVRCAFLVSPSEVMKGNLNSEVELTAQEELVVRVVNVTLRNYSSSLCVFEPNTLYAIRLRHRYQGPQSPWSLWSNVGHGRTEEAAPSEAPAFWRQLEGSSETGRRLISLLWKPLPRLLANSRVLFYNVTCQTEGGKVLRDHGSCTNLRNPRTFCSLPLPDVRCSCTLRAFNSAGASENTRIWISGMFEPEPLAPLNVSVSPLDDNHLEVHWTRPDDGSITGFVVEWFAVREQNSSVLHWQRLSRFSTTSVITEGVTPLERYAVSVKVLYGERGAGQNWTCYTYTREGVPSAGPTMSVHSISGGKVELTWSPVPVELLHGFIRGYTLYYRAANQHFRVTTLAS